MQTCHPPAAASSLMITVTRKRVPFRLSSRLRFTTAPVPRAWEDLPAAACCQAAATIPGIHPSSFRKL